MEKRKSAADLFMEQQTMPEMEMDMDEVINVSENAPLFAATSFDKNAPAPSLLKAKKAEVKKTRKLNLVDLKSSEELQLEKEPVKVRITGFGFWKRVIVPPNVYVIQTRIGKKAPLTLGLGVSFNYNPDKDAFMVVPAAMQTIGVVANCISKEKQGINILAYLQWQIADFSIAYKKLDFSESRDPLGIVNAQLREQAEAAIKDKIATMSVDEVLTDKAPIIDELTSRLKAVAEGKVEGSHTTDEGLGIKITTVQIREAIVCSETLWSDIQSPFRNELRKKSRISYLETEKEITQKELESKLIIETEQSKTDLEIETIRQKRLTETNQIRIQEESLRFALEQEDKQKNTSLEEKTKLIEKESIERMLARDNELKLKREIENKNIESQLEEKNQEIRTKKIELDLIIQEKENELLLLKEQQQIEHEKLMYIASLDKQSAEHSALMKIRDEKQAIEAKYRQQNAEIEKYLMEIQNLKNNQVIFSEFISQLPKIAAEMPEIKDLKIIQTGGNDQLFNSLTTFLSSITALAETMGLTLPKKLKEE